MARYKAEYKSANASNAWSGIGTYGSESEALRMAQQKKSQGAYLVRVTDERGNVIYSE
jgi:hypothetical protein